LQELTQTEKSSFLQDASKENYSLYQHVGKAIFFPPFISAFRLEILLAPGCWSV